MIITILDRMEELSARSKEIKTDKGPVNEGVHGHKTINCKNNIVKPVTNVDELLSIWKS